MHAHHKYGFIGLLFMASIQQTPQGPVIVLKESALQQKGKEAQQNNITAAKLVSELVRSSRDLEIRSFLTDLGDVTYNIMYYVHMETLTRRNIEFRLMKMVCMDYTNRTEFIKIWSAEQNE